MKNIIYSLLLIALINSVQKVSAATEVIALKATACIITAPGGVAIYHRQWGVKSSSSAVELGCSIALPKRAYSSITVTASGYNRTSSGLLGQVSATDNLGTNFVVENLDFPVAQSAGQVVSKTLTLNSSSSNPNQFLFISWTIYSGENYLTGLEITATY